MAEKILIVDDDLDTLKLVGLMLQRQGYEIIAANSGSQGLAKAASERPDLMLLDVMMPDMDGYEVTRRVRSDPGLSHIPIIMFTAKTLIDDKVAGFEAGVDDYLTKPTHPSELTAHVKAVLARASSSRAVPTERARVVAFTAAKGGMGTTTLALNISVGLAQAEEDVILCDLRPGAGTLGLLLGYTKSTGLSNLLGKRADEISLRLIEGQLIAHSSGVRLLLASANPADSVQAGHVAQMEAVVKNLAAMCKILILDLPPGLPEINRKLVNACDKLVVLVEPQRVSLQQTKGMLAELEGIGYGTGRVELVLINRERSGLQMNWQQVQDFLGQNISSIITPAPELAYQAAEGGVPMITAQPQSLFSDQVKKLSQQISQKLRPSGAK